MVDLSYDSVVLIASVNVCANSPVLNLVDKPFVSFFRIRLFFSSKMRKLRRVDASNAYMKLCNVSKHEFENLQILAF